MSSLEAAINLFNDEETAVFLKVRSLAIITEIIKPHITFSVDVDSSLDAARKEFFKVLKKDLCTVDNICKFLMKVHEKDPSDSNDVVFWMLITVSLMSSELTDPTFNVRLMDNGFILRLLRIIPKLNEKSFNYTVLILLQLIQCNFQSCGYLERSIYMKGAIFSRLPMLYDISMKFGAKEPIVVNFLILFSNYLLTEDWRYFKSDVKSHIKDRTLCNIVKLASDLNCCDVGAHERYICMVVDSFHKIFFNCVQGTNYERAFRKVELRLLNRLAVNNFSAICKDFSGHTLRNVLYFLCEEIKSANPKDIQFFLDSKIYEKLATKCVSSFSHKGKIDYYILCNVIACLNALEVATMLENSIKLRSVRCLIRILPDLVDSKRHLDSTAPPNFFMCRIILAASLLRRKLHEEHYLELRQRNILPLLVENVKKFYNKVETEIVHLSFTMILLCIAPEHLTCWLSLSEIDQVLPGFPIILQQLSGKSICKFYYLQIADGLDLILTRICFWLVTNLLRIKENRKHICISTQLNAFRECDFIPSLGRAIIRTEDAPVANWLVYTLYKSCQLFGNNEVMKSLREMLPELDKKQLKCYDEAGNKKPQAFSFQCFWIMRKAAAYILDDLHPDFVWQIAIQVMGDWQYFEISGGRMFFSLDEQTNKEDFEIKPVVEESFVDLLRGTWWMIKKYPHLVNTELPKLNPLFQSSSISTDTDITDLVSTIIIQTIESYLDYSEDKSTYFLIELTAFVKDLSFDSVTSDIKKKFCEVLLPACERFMALNKNQAIALNLQIFIEANKGVI